ncbi:hypothetical protein [Sorangium sp. So ce385]|uniref:hypothetical protein n=1 Tax=Sorangium sp. So ce385 TaxID=3133308 RepID=UPI003F5BC873
MSPIGEDPRATPDDPGDTPMTITGALALSASSVYLSATFAAPGDYTPHTRLFLYDEGGAPPWTAHDVGFFTVGLEKQAAPGEDLALCALSLDGEVELRSARGAVIEPIPEAGLRRPTSKGYGFLTALRRVGDRLFACGSAGQVYRRLGPGRWAHADAGLLQAPPGVDFQDLVRPVDLQGPAEDDLYLAAQQLGPRGLEGSLFHLGGPRWRRLAVPPVGGLNAVHVESAQRIWVCGHEGALLVGNHRDGFRSVSRERSPHLFHAVAMYQETLYLGSNFGLFRYDLERRRALRVRTGLEQELRYIHTIEQAGGVLWCVGPTDIARFDGERWTRVHPPEAPKGGG